MSPNRLTSSDVFSAIGDARRRRILEILRDGETSVGALANALGIAQPSVSQHLAVLSAVGLVSSVKRGTSSLYSLEPIALCEVRSWIDALDPDSTSGGVQAGDSQ